MENMNAYQNAYQARPRHTRLTSGFYRTKSKHKLINEKASPERTSSRLYIKNQDQPTRDEDFRTEDNDSITVNYLFRWALASNHVNSVKLGY